MENQWWRHGAVYQVYIRSFADGNGDGTGDIEGLITRLPYLQQLGIDAIWLNPWYESPLSDGGYDVADYRRINHRFGTNAQAEAFIEEAHGLGIRVIVDLVPNHTSNEHEWFTEATAAPPGDPSRGRYIIRPGKGEDGSEPPNDWQAVFGGSAWEQLPDGEWYLHLFDVSQPDLDWTNPEVRDEFHDILRFWLDLGVDGFRVDVAHGLAKDQTFRDYANDTERTDLPPPPGHPHWDRDELHEIVRGWRAITDDYPGDRMLLAEAWVLPSRLPLYVRPDEYHLSFSFAFATAAWDAKSFRSIISSTLAEAASVGAPATWVLSNHDIVRHATRFGLPAGTIAAEWLLDGPHDQLDPDLGHRRARASSLMMLALPGTAYLYQGDELGLPEVWDLDPALLDDPIWTLSSHTRKGRDGCRVPIPWTEDGPSFGFGASQPWLPQPPTWGALSAAAQERQPDSTLNLYRAALAFRSKHFCHDEAIEWLELAPQTVAFRRGSGVVSVTNFGPTSVELGEVEVLLSSAPLPAGALAPNTTAWVRLPLDRPGQ